MLQWAFPLIHSKQTIKIQNKLVYKGKGWVSI